jgi:hypothetical protein
MSRVPHFEASGRPQLTPVRPVLPTGQMVHQWDWPGPLVRPASVVCCTPDLWSWLCGSTSNLVVLISTRIPIMTWLPQSSRLGLGFVAQPMNNTRLRLAILATMRPTLGLGSHRVPQTKPTCLSTPWRPHKHRHFMLVLHLHQRKSGRNFHLQY